MSIEEKIHIIHEVLIEFKSHEDISRTHKISKRLVSFLVNKAKKNHNFLKELNNKKHEKDGKTEKIITVTN